MSTDSTDPTRDLGTTGDAGTSAPHPQSDRPAPGAPEAPGAQSMPKPDAGADPRKRLVAVRSEVGKAVVGQEAAVTGLVIALLAGGHVLLEGVPGVAKTLLVRSLATALDVETKRIQFTPDLMPGDVTGSLIYDSRSARFSFRAGPVFTNLLLADEINRTPPKTQSALLEAMEERQVSVDGEPRALSDPFMVIATRCQRLNGTASCSNWCCPFPSGLRRSRCSPATPRASIRATWSRRVSGQWPEPRTWPLPAPR